MSGPVGARIRWSSPAGSAGAIGAIDLAGDVDGALRAAGIALVPVGAVALRSFFGLDEGIVARVSASAALLTPHGGPAVVRAVLTGFVNAGVPIADVGNPREFYPEAADEIEARMLAAIAAATSPRAVDVLMEHASRWRRLEGAPGATADARVLGRLLSPPLVVMRGGANIGKSTLLNTLAGRRVSIVADEPGTTRDHVGAMIDLDGLVVRLVDVPGRRDEMTAEEASAFEIASALASQADLVLACGDAATPPMAAAPAEIRVALRCDRGRAAWPHDVAVSAATGEGIEELVGLLRRTLLPDEALADPRPWKWW